MSDAIPTTPAPTATPPTAPPTVTPPPNSDPSTPPPQDGTSLEGNVTPPAPTTPPPAGDAGTVDPPSPTAFDAFKTNKGATTPPAADGDIPPTDGEPADWKSTLPPSMQDDSYINRFQSMDEFLKGVKNLQQLASKKGLERPADDAPPEHWNEYWDSIGRPKSPEDYTIDDLKDSTGEVTFEFDKESLKELLPELHRRGYTNDQAQFMMEKYADIQTAQQAEAKLAHEKRTEQTLTNLQAEYKESTDPTIKRALTALENLGIYDVLAEHGLETSEPFIRAGIKLSQEFSEAVVGTGASVKTHMDRLTEIENSDAFRHDRDPNHKKAVAERLRILKEMH